MPFTGVTAMERKKEFVRLALLEGANRRELCRRRGRVRSGRDIGCNRSGIHQRLHASLGRDPVMDRLTEGYGPQSRHDGGIG